MRKQVLKVRNWVHDEGTNQGPASVSQYAEMLGKLIPITDYTMRNLSKSSWASEIVCIKDDLDESLGLNLHPFSYLSPIIIKISSKKFKIHE